MKFLILYSGKKPGCAYQTVTAKGKRRRYIVPIRTQVVKADSAEQALDMAEPRSSEIVLNSIPLKGMEKTWIKY